MLLITVDFPAPLGPRRIPIFPSGTVKPIPSAAKVFPYFLVKLTTSNIMFHTLLAPPVPGDLYSKITLPSPRSTAAAYSSNRCTG